MKKLTIEISDEAHLELLKAQLDERVKENKLTLSATAALVIEKCLLKEKAAK